VAELDEDRLAKLEEIVSRMRPVDPDGNSLDWSHGELPVFRHTFESFRDLLAEVRRLREREALLEGQRHAFDMDRQRAATERDAAQELARELVGQVTQWSGAHAEALERVQELEGEARQANALLRVYKGTNGRLAARTEMVEQALVAVREQAGEEDWFAEDRPISLIHLGHLQKPNPDCELCAARGRRSAQP